MKKIKQFERSLILQKKTQVFIPHNQITINKALSWLGASVSGLIGGQ